MLIEHMSKGLSYRSFAGLIGVHFDSLYEWEKKHKAFSDAKKVGLPKSLYAYEKTIWAAAHGKIANFNSTAAVWFGKNVHNWTDKQEISSNDNGIKINYNVIPKKK
jgi:hypothetical protein